MTINYYAPFGDGTYWRNITDLDDTTYGQIAIIDGKRKLVVGDKIGELCLVDGKRRYWVEAVEAVTPLTSCQQLMLAYKVIFNGVTYYRTRLSDYAEFKALYLLERSGENGSTVRTSYSEIVINYYGVFAKKYTNLSKPYIGGSPDPSSFGAYRQYSWSCPNLTPNLDETYYTYRTGGDDVCLVYGGPSLTLNIDYDLSEFVLNNVEFRRLGDDTKRDEYRHTINGVVGQWTQIPAYHYSPGCWPW